MLLCRVQFDGLSEAARSAARVLATALLTGLLAGCSLLGTSEAPLATYDLISSQGTKPTHGPGEIQVLIPEPASLKSLDTQHIVVRPAPSEISYYPGAQWSDRLPRLVQNRLVEAFETSGRIRAGTPGQGLAIDYQVLTDLRAFDYNAAAKLAHVEIAVKLMNDKDGKILATQLFAGDAPVETDTAAHVTAALDDALSGQLRAIVAWTAKRI